MASKPIQVKGYARLSREDLRGPGTTEEKLAARKQMCLNLAEQYGLPLNPDDVVCEVATATKLVGRPGLVGLLEEARAGKLTHLITPYQNRLTRGGDADRGTVKESLCAGCVTLVTFDGVMAFDRDFGDRHEFIFDVQAAAASYEVREAVKRRRNADLVALKAGKPHRSAAPYGYHCVTKQDVLSALYPPEQLKTFVVIPEEYVILEEIFRRLKTEKAPEICRELNTRGIPPPGSTRPGKKGVRWYPWCIYNLIRNPFYIGILSQKSRVERGRGKVRFKPSEFILSDVRGDWPTPPTEEEWFALQGRIEGHKERAASRTGLLTGLLYCPNGRPMRVAANNLYGCICKELGEAHPGAYVSGDRVTAWVQMIVNNLVDALPPELQSTPKRNPDKVKLQTELTKFRRELIEKEQQAQDMILREKYFVSLLGRSVYETTAKKTKEEMEKLRGKVEELQSVLATPDVQEVFGLVQGIRSVGGMARFWETSSRQQQRTLIEGIIERIDMVAPTKRFYTEAGATLHEWTQPYAPELPPFPKVPGGPDNLKRYRERETD